MALSSSQKSGNMRFIGCININRNLASEFPIGKFKDKLSKYFGKVFTFLVKLV